MVFNKRDFLIKFKPYGVRGSIPSPGKYTKKYGGNTSCYSLTFKGSKENFIIDAGSGIRELGLDLQEKKRSNIYHIILTHTHWDHVMGLPFFSPMFDKNAIINFYGPKNVISLEKIIGNNFKSFYFPVQIEQLPSKITYTELDEETFFIDGIKFTSRKINHPIVCYGYRIEHHGKIFSTCYDYEQNENSANMDYLKNSDIVLIDAQYTKEEYFAEKIGWGHSYYDASIQIAKNSNAKKCLLTHYDPERTDKENNKIIKVARKQYKGINFDMAREKKTIYLR